MVLLGGSFAIIQKRAATFRRRSRTMNFGFKLLALTGLLGIALIQTPSFAAEFGGHGGGGGEPHGSAIRKRPAKGTTASSFPKYPVRSQISSPNGGRPVFQNVPAHADSLGNRVTADHLNRVEFAGGRSEALMRNDVHVTDVVRAGRAHFVNFYRPEFVRKTVVIDGFVNRYNSVVIGNPPFLGAWRSHYFYGGLYWGFHPVVDIDAYFYNPMVYWFYVPTADDHYYRNWYADRYDAYPELHKPFEFHGLYYPTENLKQLLFGVSAMSVEKQVAFREAISRFTRVLAQKMANGLDAHVHLSNGDVDVTHYEVIGYDNAIDLEGFVTFEGKGYNFKGLVDLESPNQTDVFVPATWDKNPSPEQLSTLDSLNERINTLKGEPAQEQPAPVSAVPTPGEVQADPDHK
jgi:hypothetical protein